MKDVFNEDSTHDFIYLISLAIWVLLSVIFIIGFVELKRKSMIVHSLIVALLGLNVLCRTAYFTFELFFYTYPLAQAIVNRLGVMFQFSGITVIIYFWMKTLTHIHQHILYLIIVVFNLVTWTFLFTMTFVCFHDRCKLFYIGLLFISVINLVMVGIVLAYGEYTNHR
jgi:hypothetical protein